MRYFTTILTCSMLVGCGRIAPVTPQQRLDRAKKELAEATSERARFYVLGRAAKDSFAVRNRDDARLYATDLMTLIPKKDWTMFSHRLILHGRQVCFARKASQLRLMVACLFPT